MSEIESQKREVMRDCCRGDDEVMCADGRSAFGEVGLKLGMYLRYLHTLATFMSKSSSVTIGAHASSMNASRRRRNSGSRAQ